jgi:HPt (histidine-containing phosphotransfer) domain-containing protein
MDDCLTKPFEAKELHRLIDRWTQASTRVGDPPQPRQVATVELADPKSALDAKVIRALRRLSSADGPNLLEKMGRLYLESMPKDLADLEYAIESPTSDTVSSIAHRLKSVAGNIGARELATLFGDLEDKASARQLREANTAMRKIKIEFERTVIALQGEITGHIMENAVTGPSE